MHWYTRFCVFGWVVNSAMGPNYPAKNANAENTKNAGIQTHAEGVFGYRLFCLK